MVWLLKCALKIINTIGPLVGVAVGLFSVVAWIAGIVGGIVGIWDGLVWLFKADWRTTHFQVVLLAGIVFVPSLVLVGILTALLEELEEWSERLTAKIEVKKQLAAGRRAP